MKDCKTKDDEKYSFVDEQNLMITPKNLVCEFVEEMAEKFIEEREEGQTGGEEEKEG